MVENQASNQRSPVRILMWSGPRNISTAMLRSFGNREDTFVSDEPLYGYYLKETGFRHPGYRTVIAAQESNWQAVVDSLTSAVPQRKTIWYQKQMAHHLLPAVDRGWLDRDDIVNAFLIREPREMLTSLINVLGDVELHQTALPQQVEILRMMKAAGKNVVVVDSRDVLENPREMLSKLCVRLGISFCERMLNWPPGPRDTDGVWAEHWYANVYKTTTFGTYKPKQEKLPARYREMLKQCEDLYGEMAEHRI